MYSKENTAFRVKNTLHHNLYYRTTDINKYILKNYRKMNEKCIYILYCDENTHINTS